MKAFILQVYFKLNPSTGFNLEVLTIGADNYKAKLYNEEELVSPFDFKNSSYCTTLYEKRCGCKPSVHIFENLEKYSEG